MVVFDSRKTTPASLLASDSLERSAIHRIVALFAVLFVVSSVFTHIPLNSDLITPSMRRIPWVIYAREALYLGFMTSGIYYLFTAGAWRPLLFAFIFGLISTFALVYGIFSGSQVDLAFAARSLFLTISCILITAIVSSNIYIVKNLPTLLISIIILQIIFIGYQLQTLPPLYGRTFIGPRVFGTLASPLHLAMFSGAVAIFFAATRSKHSIPVSIICVFIALSAGGRAGILLSTLGLIGSLYVKYDFSSRVKLMTALASVPAVYVLAQLASNPVISGRSGTSAGVLGDGRWDAWAIALESILNGSVFTVLFGVGVGSGSNAAISFTGQGIYTDSMFVFLILNFGLIGLVLFSLCFIATSKFYGGISALALAGWVIIASAQLVLELTPTNFILLSSIGVLVERNASNARQQRAADSNRFAQHKTQGVRR